MDWDLSSHAANGAAQGRRASGGLPARLVRSLSHRYGDHASHRIAGSAIMAAKIESFVREAEPVALARPKATEDPPALMQRPQVVDEAVAIEGDFVLVRPQVEYRSVRSLCQVRAPREARSEAGVTQLEGRARRTRCRTCRCGHPWHYACPASSAGAGHVSTARRLPQASGAMVSPRINGQSPRSCAAGPWLRWRRSRGAGRRA